MVSGKDPNTVDTQDPVKSTVPNYGYSLRKGDFAQRPMSMKKFLEPFDHSSLTNTEAGEKYAAYKASFIRQQLEEFFERNKAHAWFREKYHPDYCTELSSCTKLFEKRLEIFMEFYKNGYLNNLHLTSGYESEIVRLLDMVAIKLAGGTEEDFILLDKLNEDQNSNDFSMIIEESSHQQERNYEASNNGVQSSEVQQAQQIQKNSDKKLTKKAKPKTGSKQNSKSQSERSQKLRNHCVIKMMMKKKKVKIVV
ncbi:unnamed protein product [Heterobilharzia americana]|nr:unnamed protein product [Heterobilharzia americana]